jgi:NTP pyrophosphatase (non-canonical NTP hydrolase)
MDLLEYIPLALTTKAPSDMKDGDLIHAAMGLVTEIGELVDNYKKCIFYKKDFNLVNFKEELGDIAWYLAVGFSTVIPSEEGRSWTLKEMQDESKSIRDIDDSSTETDLPYLAFLTEFSSEIFLAAALPEDRENAEILYNFGRIYYVLIRLLARNIPEYSLEQALEDNIEKLRKRYPNKFSTESAVNRDTVNELSHIHSTELMANEPKP